MRAALLAFLLALLAFAPLASAQAGNIDDLGLEGAAPPAAADATPGLPLDADVAAPQLAQEGHADRDPLRDGAEPEKANVPVFPQVGGVHFCILDNTVVPLGGCFVSGIGHDPAKTLDNGSDDPPASPPSNEAEGQMAEETGHGWQDNESAAAAMDAPAAPPSDPLPAPTPSHGGAPSQRSPTSLQMAPAPASSLSWELATAAVALPVSLLAKLASILVLRRRARDTGPTMRDAVLEAIAARPGVRHRELVRRIGHGNGTVEHHVRRLIAEGRVARLRVGASTAYALAGDLSAQEARLRLALEGRTSRSLALDVAAHPGSRLTDVAQRVGVSLATAHYQAGKLVAAGILRDAAGAGGRRLEPTPAGRACLAAVTADGPAVASPFGAPIGPRPTASLA